MKRILTILVFCFFAFISKAQFYPLPPNNLGGLNVLVRDTGGLAVRQTFQLPQYTDTTAANTMGFPKNYDGSVIYTTSDKNLWYRSVVLNQWIKVASGGGATTIYTGDGTLLSNRIVHGNNHSLQFNGQDIFTIGTDNGGISGFPYFYFVDNAGESDWQSLNMAGNTNVGRLQLQANTDTNSILIEGNTTEYLNFGGMHAFAGYGFRDSAGVMQYKNDAGTWLSFSAGVPSINIFNSNGTLTFDRTLTGDNHNLNFTGLNSFGLSTTGDITETSSAGNIINKAFQQINDTADVINIVGTTGATFQLQGINNGIGLSPDGFTDIEGTGGDGILLNSATKLKVFTSDSWYVNGDAGVSGYFLQSQGVGLPPIWAASGGGGGGGINIYNTDSLLAGDRNVDDNHFNLTFSNVNTLNTFSQGFQTSLIDSLGQWFHYSTDGTTNNEIWSQLADGSGATHLLNGGNVFAGESYDNGGDYTWVHNNATDIDFNMIFNGGLTINDVLNSFSPLFISNSGQLQLSSSSATTGISLDAQNVQIIMNYTSGNQAVFISPQNDDEFSLHDNTGTTSSKLVFSDGSGFFAKDSIQFTATGGINTADLDNYTKDVSGSFTGLSKINKDYADATYAPIGSTTNYWTLTGSDISNNNAGSVSMVTGTTSLNVNLNADINGTTSGASEIGWFSNAEFEAHANFGADNGQDLLLQNDAQNNNISINDNGGIIATSSKGILALNSDGTTSLTSNTDDLTIHAISGSLVAEADGNVIVETTTGSDMVWRNTLGDPMQALAAGNLNLSSFNSQPITLTAATSTSIINTDPSSVCLLVSQASGSSVNSLQIGRAGFGTYTTIDNSGNLNTASYTQPVFNSSMVTTDGSGKLIAATAGTDYQIPISLTTSGTSGASTFNTGTGVLNIPQYVPSNSPVIVKFNYISGQNSPQTVTTYTTGASDSSFQVSGYVNITALSVNVVQMTVSYFDETNTSRTVTLFPMGATSATLAVGNSNFPVFGEFRVKASTAITVAVTATGIGSETYNASATITKLHN